MSIHPIDYKTINVDDLNKYITFGKITSKTNSINPTYKKVLYKNNDLLLIIKNCQLKSNCIPAYNSEFMKGGEYDKQRYKLKLDITDNKDLLKLLLKLDDLLKDFGKNIDNNANYFYDTDDIENSVKFVPMCKKPSKKKLETYKKNHPGENLDDKEILKKLKTYLQINFKLPYKKMDNNDNKNTTIYTKDTAIDNNDLLIKIDKNVDFDINRPYTLDFLDELTRWGNNVDILFSINSWFSSSSMYGYKLFVKGIKLHSLGKENKNIIWDDDDDENNNNSNDNKNLSDNNSNDNKNSSDNNLNDNKNLNENKSDDEKSDDNFNNVEPDNSESFDEKSNNEQKTKLKGKPKRNNQKKVLKSRIKSKKESDNEAGSEDEVDSD